MARILIIEDEPRIALAVQRGLQDELHAADVERNGSDGLRAVETREYDLVLLDRMLPGLAGLEVCRRIRRGGSAVPILMLTAKDTAEDVVAGLDAGADDYLTKPFAFAVLIARVRALLRRSAGQASPRFTVGPLEVDSASHRVWRDGVEISLTAKEFQLLEVLVRKRGTVLSKLRLAETVWERDAEPESNAVEVHVASLRRKLDRDRGPQLIHTIRGVGYVVRVEEP